MKRLALVLTIILMTGCADEKLEQRTPSAFYSVSITEINSGSGYGTVSILRHIKSDKCLAVLMGYSKGAVAQVPDEMCQ